MSKQQHTLIIQPNGEAVREEYVFPDFACPYCNERGGFDHSGYLAKFKKNFNDPDWIVCKVCNGAKRIFAEVTVEWYPVETKNETEKA